MSADSSIQVGHLVTASEYHPANAVFKVLKRHHGWLVCVHHCAADGTPSGTSHVVRFRVNEMRRCRVAVPVETEA